MLIDYLNGSDSLREFYDLPPDLKGFQKAIAQHPEVEHRGLLVKELFKQYNGLIAESSAVGKNIQSLSEKNTYTVTTGHQVNLFTGPLYFIYKIVSTIKLCQQLKQQFPDCNFVPIYWMATEDHDFEEINFVKLYGKKIQWDTESYGAVGRLKLDDIKNTVEQYTAALGLSPHADKLRDIVSKAYLEHDTLAQATRYLVHQLFHESGLVIVDADSKDFKSVFTPYIKKDIVEQISYKNVSATDELLQERGYKTQVFTREINFFYLHEGKRSRLVLEGKKFKVFNQEIEFTEDEILQEIDRFPEKFSPNVIMRPVYQEVLLPNLAYIGGGAEVAYWLQLKSTFQELNVTFPILIPRNSAMVMNKKTAEKIFRLDFSFKSIFKSEDVLKSEFVKRTTKHRLNLNDEWLEINGVFSKIKLRAHKIDPTLSQSTDAVKARLKKSIKNLEKKLLRAEKKNHAEALIQIGRVKEQLFPDGVLQERVENFAPYYLRYGDDFIKDLLKHFQPLDFQFTVLYK